MARIRPEDVDAVRERTDLVRLVQQYVALKKAGRSFTGLCPFHTEKTPSLSVDPAKGLYYCFGCGAGGNAFRFLEQIENITFPEAVERLANQAGIVLRYEGVSPGERRTASRRQSLYRVNARAGDLYHRFLKEAREADGARRYLSTRAISPESLETFGIGYAPGYPDFLLRRLSRDLSPELLVEAGVALRDSKGGVRDRFRARVTFPVHDLSGQAVGFGARLLEGDGPKYMNSPETPIYRKGEMLYNLHRAKAEVVSTGRAVVVEGYTDVIALHQAGVRTAVATCGTALSEGHLRLLSRFARQVVLAFDSDEAGARAAERAYGFFEAYPLEIQVLILPRGEDPADFVSAHGAPAFEELAAGARSLVEYMIERTLQGRDLDGPEGKAAAVRDALPIVAGLADAVRRSRYASVLADRVNVPTESVLLELERRRRSEEQPTGAGGDGGAERTKPRVRDAGREVEREALKLLAQHPELCSDHTGALTEDRFATERHRRALALLTAPRSSAAELADRAREQGLGELMAELSLEPLKGDQTPEYAGRVFSRLEELGLKRRIDTMRKRLERLNPVTDAETFDPLFKELADLTGRWREARARAGEGA